MSNINIRDLFDELVMIYEQLKIEYCFYPCCDMEKIRLLWKRQAEIYDEIGM